MRKRLLRVLDGETLDVPPLWMMRQAGRYLPEYRALRAEAGSFLDLCYHPARAAEVTLQPIRRFGFDAAILFSDILVVPHALGLDLSFVEGEGPRLQTVSGDDIGRLRDTLDPAMTVPVYEAVERVRTALPAETALIGFVGAPWTVATYMAVGRGSPDHAEARLWAYRDPKSFSRLIDLLVRVSVDHLDGQVRAGAEVVQIFDSWAGELPPDEFERWCVAPLAELVSLLRARRPGLPVIVFARAAGTKLARLVEALPDVAIGLDTAEDPHAVRTMVPAAMPVQGNLDPLALVAGGAALDAAVRTIREGFRGRPHIFNLGHGIRRETPIAHVDQLVRAVRRELV